MTSTPCWPRCGPMARRPVIVEAPMSYTGSARRIWRHKRGLITGTFLLGVIAAVWCIVSIWYVLFGLLLVPYRLVRRGQRQRKAVAR